MPCKPPALPLPVVRDFIADMNAYFAEEDIIRADAIAARQLHVLRQHLDGRLRLSDVKILFEQMQDFVVSHQR